MTDRYIGTVGRVHIEAACEFLKKYPTLQELFNDAWLSNLMIEGQDIYSTHPLLGQLSAARDTFAQAIIKISEEVGISPINNLKKCTNTSDFIAAVREIETYSEFRKRKIEVTWKPKIKGKNPDLLLKCNPNIYLEIFTITSSDSDRAEQAAQDKTNAEINKISPNPYLLSIHYKRTWEEGYIAGFLDFVSEKIMTLQSSELDQEIEYKLDGEILAEVTFRKSESLEGGVVLHMSGGFINNSGRIKNKILSKLQNFQLPPKESDTYINGYLIFLESIFHDNFDVETAVKGQATLKFPMKDGVPEEGSTPTQGHASNGVIHSTSWDEAITSNLDFIASTKSSNGVILTNSQSMVLLSDRLKISPEELREMLFDSNS